MFCPLCFVYLKISVSFSFILFSASIQSTEVRFSSFLSGGFTTMAVINPPERKLAKRTCVHCAAYRCPWVKNIASKTFTEDEGFDRIIFHKMRLDTWNVQCNFFTKVFVLTFCWAKSLVLSVSLHVKQALNVKAVNNLFLSFKLFIFHCFDKLDLNNFCSYNFKFLNILRKFSRFPLRRARLLSLSGGGEQALKWGQFLNLVLGTKNHSLALPRTFGAFFHKTQAEHGYIILNEISTERLLIWLETDLLCSQVLNSIVLATFRA